ncbi:MAG: NAD(P)-dependent oxidoreductase [Aquificae bacterium]|nr:NAD(P)-dependent oxidoreductase [Aquificota bacterium]
MKVLITGASGFIGKNFLKKLQNTPYEIVTITRKPFSLGKEKNYSLDLKNSQKLKDILEEEKPDTVVHLAAGGVKYGEGTLEDIFKINAFSIINILDILKEINHYPKIIVAGSGFEYSLKNEPLKETDCLNPLSLYGISKATQSMLLRRYKDDFTIFLLRFFSVYGVGEASHRFFPYIISETIKGNKVKLTGCEQIRDFINVEDVSQCLLEFLKKDEEKGFFDFNVASGKEISLKEAVNIISNLLKKYGFEPDIEFGALPYRKDEPMYYVADINKLKNYLNWEPKISLEEGLEKLIQEHLDVLKRENRDYS